MSWRVLLVPLLILLAAGAVAQQPRLPQGHPLPQRPGGVYESQLQQVDQLIRLDQLSRANALLEQLAEVGAPAADLRKRRIRIALGIGEPAQARDLCREALAEGAADPEIWRHLVSADLALGDTDGARQAIDEFLRRVDDPRVGFATAVDLTAAARRPQLTVALIDSARVLLGDTALLARPRAVHLLALGRADEAAREVAVDLVASPYNLPFLRRDLLGEGAPSLPPAFERALRGLAAAPGALPELAILAANVQIARGDAGGARDLVLSHLGGREAVRAALANAGVLTTELPVLADGPERTAQVDYLLDVLPACARAAGLTPRQRQQALDNLAGACMFALQNRLLADDPRQAAARFGELLEQVRQGDPESSELYAAQIELARFTREQLHDPAGAAARLETLLQDLDLPLEGVALARLALGESYLAARDTSRARQVLTALGRDRDFRAPAGRAHYLLARLDLAEGHIGTARDRFAAVALDNPSAPYANEALGLGLVIAEELQNPTGGPDLLLRYARAVWFELVDEPDSQRVALHDYLERAEVQVDPTAPQPLLELARFELAGLERAAGRYDHALAQLDRIVTEQPAGRLAARSLALRGEILADDRLDTAAARREYERLLTQYPDYLFAGEIRQRLRDLP
ncbi:MAG: hypothetical protein R3D98_09530 [Candidatus Krumholzibacteriia bacterium]